MSFLNTVKDEARSLAEVVSGISFSKSYKTPTTKKGKEVVGFNDHAFSQIDERYKVTIENSEWIVNAWLQENFSFRVGSTWGPLLGSNFLLEKANQAVSTLVKGVSGYALKNMALTRRRWEGSDPLVVELKLKFRAYEDADREVVKAVHALQSMTLPAEVGNIPWLAKQTGSKSAPMPGFVVPPGPNEFYMNPAFANIVSKLPGFGGEGAKNQRFGGAGDIISLSLFGGSFLLDLVIIKSVEASFDPKMTTKGPVAASVNVLLESYEVLTKDKLKNAYEGTGYIVKSNKQATPQGNITNQ